MGLDPGLSWIFVSAFVLHCCRPSTCTALSMMIVILKVKKKHTLFTRYSLDIEMESTYFEVDSWIIILKIFGWMTSGNETRIASSKSKFFKVGSVPEGNK